MIVGRYDANRFWQIDPLASDYPYNSPYALQENKFGMGMELEGAELQPFYPNLQGELYNAAGVNTSTSAEKVGKELLSRYVKAIGEIMLTALPAEELVLGGLGLAAKELGVLGKIEGAGMKAFELGNTASKYEGAAKGGAAYETALAGRKHSGFLKNYIGRNADEIGKSIKSMQSGKQGISVHLDKIANPTKYVPNWNTLRPSHQIKFLIFHTCNFSNKY